MGGFKDLIYKCIGFGTTNKPPGRVRREQFVSSCIYIHGYIPFYLTIDIIYDISLSQIQTKGMGEGVVSLIY